MSIVQKSIIAAAFSMAVAGMAAAQQVLPAPSKTGTARAISVRGEPDRNYQLYLLEEDVKVGGAYTQARVLVDKALGISCEWKEVGVKLPDKDGAFFSVPREFKAVGCVPSSDVPESWADLKPKNYLQSSQQLLKGLLEGGMDKETALKTLNGIEAEERAALGDLSLHKKDTSLLIEKIGGQNPHAISELGIAHVWNLASREVCLMTSQPVYDGPKRKMLTHNWGCFPINNKDYFQRVQTAFGIKDL